MYLCKLQCLNHQQQSILEIYIIKILLHYFVRNKIKVSIRA